MSMRNVVNLAIALAAIISSVQPTFGEPQKSDLNPLSGSSDSTAKIWQYFLNKYSSSKSVLTDREIANIINQNCLRNRSGGGGGGGGGLAGNGSGLSNSVHDSCEISQEKFNNVSGLHPVCNYILYHIDNPGCCTLEGDIGSEREEDEGPEPGRRKPSSSEVWGFGVLFVTVISLTSLLGVSLLPVMGKSFYDHLLTLLVGLAVGSLTGSSVFHLLPQAFGLNEIDPEHGYVFISLVACGGIWMFFMVERILKFIMDYKDRREKCWRHEQSADPLASTPENGTFLALHDGESGKKEQEDSGSSSSSAACAPPRGVIYESQEQAIKASFGHQEKPRPSNGHEHMVKFEQGKDSVIATVAWMIIFGDGLHNFIDGISIGAAFNESILTGISISLAVLCEELPHELGDFAVLLKAGMSMRQAVLYNFLSACTCYLGLGFGIVLGEMEGSSYIFAVAGGMFLYIALVDMVPEMNEKSEETSKLSFTKWLNVLLLQNVGLFSGVTILFALAKYQNEIKIG